MCIRRAKYSLPKKDKSKKSFLTLPFTSEEQARAIRTTLRKCGLQDHLIVSFASRNLASHLKPRKHKACPKENCSFCAAGRGTDCWTKECVYKIECSHCNAFYIGETKRTIRSRVREHISMDTSLVFQHIKSHSSHPAVSDIAWSIVHRGLGNWALRRRVELSEIENQGPDINIQH